MGLLSAVLTAPLAPVRGVVWVGERLVEEAQRVRAESVRLRLAQLEEDLRAGRIDEPTFDRLEEQLWEELGPAPIPERLVNR
jgi:hypothetical protein